MDIYKLSGKASPLGVLKAFSWGVLAACVSSFIYGVFTYYIPTIYLLWLPTLAYVLALGGCIGAAAMKEQIRNTRVATVLSFGLGLLAVYLSWVSWLYFYDQSLVPDPHLILNPLELFYSILDLGHLGAFWSVTRGARPEPFTLEGTSVYCAWIVEALAIIFMTPFFALSTFDRAVFCEKCYHWLNKDDDKLLFLEALNEKLTRPRLIGGDLSVLNEIGLYQNLPTGKGELPKPSTLVTLRRCKNCSYTYLLNVDEITYRHGFYTTRHGASPAPNKVDEKQKIGRAHV